MPSRRLIKLRPAVPADTALDVAITVIRPVAAATLKSRPRPAFSSGTRNTPPPMPSSDPSPPAIAPAATTAAMTVGCIILAGFKFYRMFQRFFDEGLAQASFLVGCDRTKQAVVIDPRRDAAIYTAAARQLDATIGAAIETHVHADFVSGARELAHTGARVFTGPGADLEYPHHETHDGETLAVGDLRLTFLHTPGHTWEHIAILAEAPGEPVRLFTGDLLFVGGVGRPDLLGEAQTRQLASDLFDSLNRIMALDDRVEIHPGHGAGSLCGAGIGREPSSTIGRERSQNALLRHRDRDAFITAVLADIPATPPYFARMKRVNKAGAALLDERRPLPSIRPAAAAALSADGAIILDLRPAAAFTT